MSDTDQVGVVIGVVCMVVGFLFGCIFGVENERDILKTALKAGSDPYKLLGVEKPK